MLPTSGSQGCTAAVVELVFNSSLLESPTSTRLEDGAEDQEKLQVPVYRGEVEFLKKEEWEKELRILVQECCTDKGRLYAQKSSEKAMPAASAAWAKINQGELSASFSGRASLRPSLL